MNLLRLKNICLLTIMLLFLNGCVEWGREIENPTRPTSVRGWKKYETGSIGIKGEFVLKKGETTHNGQIGIRVVDLIAAKYHLFDSPELPKAKVQFFRVSDQAVICEGVFTRGSNRVDLPDLCKNNLEWSVIYIRDVNHDEGWVFLDLR